MAPLEFEVEVRETVKIHAPPHESKLLPRGPLDQFSVPHNDIPAIWFYEQKLDFKQLQESLLRIIAHFQYLCGRLVFNDGQPTDFISNNEGFPFSYAYAPKVSVKDFNFETSISSWKEFSKLLFRTESSSTHPMISIQLTEFENGGCAISICVLHCIFDACAMINFFSLWAKENRLESLEYQVEIDASILYKEEENPIINDGPRPNNFLLVEKSDERLKSEIDKVMALFPTSDYYLIHFNEEEIKNMKQIASKSSPPNTIFSTNDVITSHLWKVFTKLKKISSNEPSLMLTVCNLRGKKPSIPSYYYRNCILALHTNSNGEELVNGSLGTLALKVNSEIHSYKNQYVDQDLQNLKEIFSRNPTLKGVNFEANPFDYDVWITSWARFPIYDSDFGKGNPTWFHTPCIMIPNTFVILPAPPEMGGVIITTMVPSTLKQDPQQEASLDQSIHQYRSI